MLAGVITAIALPAGPLDARRGPPAPVRFATFNASLNRSAPGVLHAELAAALAGTVSPQLAAVRTIIDRNEPDVLLVNEFDTGADGDQETVQMFAEFARYEYSFTAPSNTGVPSGFDLNNDRTVGGGSELTGVFPFPSSDHRLVRIDVRVPGR